MRRKKIKFIAVVTTFLTLILLTPCFIFAQETNSEADSPDSEKLEETPETTLGEGESGTIRIITRLSTRGTVTPEMRQEFFDKFMKMEEEELSVSWESSHFDQEQVVDVLASGDITPEKYYDFVANEIYPGDNFPENKEDFIRILEARIESYLNSSNRTVWNAKKRSFERSIDGDILWLKGDEIIVEKSSEIITDSTKQTGPETEADPGSSADATQENVSESIEPTPSISSAESQEDKSDLLGYIKYSFNFSVAIAGFVLFGLLIRAGIIYLSSAGNPERVKRGKDLFLSSFLGIIILLASYLILSTINPQLVVFKLPELQQLQVFEVPELPEWEENEISLIITELPIGQAIENGLWSEAMIDKIKGLKDDNKNFLEEEITVNPTFNRIADMNKYMLTLTEKCRCEELTGLCTGPKDFREPVGCIGDPCPEETREQIEKILDINQEKINGLLEFKKKIINQKNEFAEELSKLVDIENEMVHCQQQSGTLVNFSEHLSRLNYYFDQDWQIETLSLPGVPKANADPLTFYCSSGGTISDYPYQSIEELPGGLNESEISYTDDLGIMIMTPGTGRLNCLLEIPLGTVIDELRELAIILIAKMERLADLQGKMADKVDNMKDLTSRCTDENCNINCDCVPNPCYEPACGTPPARENYCGIGRCTIPTPATPNFCYPFCNSPCLQAVGGCHGSCTRENYEDISEKMSDCIEQDCGEEEAISIYQDLKSCSDACPRNEIMAKTIEIGEIEKEIFNTIREIEQIFPQVNALIGRIESPKINLQDIREATELCQSPDTSEGEGMGLINCSSAIGNYGASGQIISDCHPRNFFCCLFSEVEVPNNMEGFFSEMAYKTATKKYQPLPAIDGCPQGWLCEPEIKSYNQYKDASKPLKELLSCMRQELDKKELSQHVGVISVISDPKLYQGTCDWEGGPVTEGGCSHPYEVKYGKMNISAHYGGPGCYFTKESYAVNFSDIINAEHLISVAKKCRPDSFISFRTSQNYQSLHISLGNAEDCGTN